MLFWSLVVLVAALLAGLSGFGGIASAFVGTAQILFAVFIVLFPAMLVLGALRG